MLKTFSPEELRVIKKILTPEQIKLIQNKVSKIFAEVRRSQFKLSMAAGDRRDSKFTADARPSPDETIVPTFPSIASLALASTSSIGL